MYRTRHKYNVGNPNDRAQLQCLKRAIQRKRFGCFFQQRVGKSRVGVDFIGHSLTQGVDTVLILCPPSASMGWITELQMLGDTGRTIHFQYWTKGAETLKTQRPLVVLSSYDLATANSVRLKKFAPQCIVFDEVHMLKNISARHKLGRMLSDKAEWVLGLTGTPFSNREYLDAYGIFRIIDPTLFGKSKVKFVQEFASFTDEFGNPVSWLADAEETILTRIAEASMRVTREDVGIILGADETVVKFKLDALEAKWYKAMRNTSVAQHEDITCAARHTWAWKTRLSQICCGILTDTELGHKLMIAPYRARLSALIELLRSPALTGKQVVVVIKFTTDVDDIVNSIQTCGRYIRIITGGLTATQRKGIVASAKKVPASVLLVQERTIAMGMDLSYADQMAFYSWSDDAILHSQVKDRITGRFQDSHTVHYYYLVAERTSDVQLLKNTLSHISKAEALVNWERYRVKGDDNDESLEALERSCT